MGNDDHDLKKIGDRLDPSFIYTQIMKAILLIINFEQKRINQFIQHCREAFANHEKQLEYVDQLVSKNRQHTPIWWYTCEFFFYSALNRALRTMDADLMIKWGFFTAQADNTFKKRVITPDNFEEFRIRRNMRFQRFFPSPRYARLETSIRFERLTNTLDFTPLAPKNLATLIPSTFNRVIPRCSILNHKIISNNTST